MPARLPSRLRGLLGAAALLAAACDGAPTPDLPASERPWVVATTVDLGGVNELVAPNVRFTRELQSLMFLDLVEEQADFADHPPSFAPALAERWEVSSDGREITFHLRPDLVWSDGEPLSASDVEFTHRAQTADAVAWPYADSKRVIEGLRVIDDRTVTFHLRSPGPYRLVDVNDGHILPRHAWGDVPFSEWRRAGDRFRQSLVASGPYVLGSWQPGVELELTPNPRYAGPGPRPSRSVLFRVVPDPAARIERLLAGEFDFADGLSPVDADRVNRSAHHRLLVGESRQYDYIAWNLRREPFDDPEIRRALTHGIDRQQLVDALFHGLARVATGPIPSYVWAHDRHLAPRPYDPAAARAALARRGYADRDGDGVVERDGRPFAFELTTNAGNRTRLDAAVMIQEHLARIGVRVTPRPVEINTLTELNLAGEFDATLMGWAIDTTLDFRPYFHSREREDGWNFIDYQNADVDRALDAASSASTAEETLPALVELQRLLYGEQPYTFLWEPPRLAAVRTGIDGAEITPLSGLASLPRWLARAPRTDP